MTSFLTVLSFIINLQCILSLKMASYNTFLTAFNPLRDTLFQQQVGPIAQSDIDIFCFQELNLIPVAAQYMDTLNALGGYSNSFSIIDVIQQYSPSDLVPPRAPCNDINLQNALTSQCVTTVCRDFYDINRDVVSFAVCMATACPADYDTILYSECLGCAGAFESLEASQFSGLYDPLSLLDAAILFCSNPPTFPTDPPTVFSDILFNFTDGNIIVTKSKYPIINTWSYIIPSWLFIEERLHIAEIDICSDTQPDNTEECTDSIIVGCTHLEALDFLNDKDIVQTLRIDDTDITSHVGLNRYQTEYIIDNIYNDDILQTLDRTDNADNIYGIFLLGDLNNGQLFNRCDYFGEDGTDIADNCQGENPSNPFDLWSNSDLIDAPDIKYKGTGNNNPDIECTYCLDPAADDFNILAQIANTGSNINTADGTSNLDHILIQDGYCKNWKATSFERIFTDKFVDGIVPGQQVATSDHYGVSLEIQFKENKGGRGGNQCISGNSKKRKNNKKQKNKNGHSGLVNDDITDDNKIKANNGNSNIDNLLLMVIVGITLFIALSAAIFYVFCLRKKCNKNKDNLNKMAKEIDNDNNNNNNNDNVDAENVTDGNNDDVAPKTQDSAELIV